ncbi:hypothetical protein VTL71DRAFT_14690 [Oculimacula yallundae]|uniref:Uncharacterized protein n=1 Tax=Oculimacula yallundae TaxID=86028 RepID=A0ABR4CJ69_9HELO
MRYQMLYCRESSHAQQFDLKNSVHLHFVGDGSTVKPTDLANSYGIVRTPMNWVGPGTSSRRHCLEDKVSNILEGGEAEHHGAVRTAMTGKGRIQGQFPDQKFSMVRNSRFPDEDQNHKAKMILIRDHSVFRAETLRTKLSVESPLEVSEPIKSYVRGARCLPRDLQASFVNRLHHMCTEAPLAVSLSLPTVSCLASIHRMGGFEFISSKPILKEQQLLYRPIGGGAKQPAVMKGLKILLSGGCAAMMI